MCIESLWFSYSWLYYDYMEQISMHLHFVSVSLFPGVMIGFEPTTYAVNESDDSSFIIVKRGVNERPVTVVLNTADGTAVGEP